MIYFATNRRYRQDDAFAINPDELRFGHWADRQLKWADESLSDKHAQASIMGSDSIFDMLRAEVRAAGRLLVFVHGYNYTFREALDQAEFMRELYETPVLLFTWPSGGSGVSLRTYSDDRVRAAASGPALARLLLKGADFMRHSPRRGCTAKIHLMAHSMGNYVLRHAVQHARAFVGDNLPPLLDDVFLVAADDDDDTLAKRHKMAPIFRGCRRVNVLWNMRDLALKASDLVGNPNRLGLSGPDYDHNQPWKKIDQWNCSREVAQDDGGDTTRHQYYLKTQTVIDRIKARIHGTESLED